jgi:hypothetical protein
MRRSHAVYSSSLHAESLDGLDVAAHIEKTCSASCFKILFSETTCQASKWLSMTTLERPLALPGQIREEVPG